MLGSYAMSVEANEGSESDFSMLLHDEASIVVVVLVEVVVKVAIKPRRTHVHNWFKPILQKNKYVSTSFKIQFIYAQHNYVKVVLF